MGRALCPVLLKAGYAVRVALRQAPMPSFPQEIEPVVVGEIGSNTSWDEALAGIDTVIHLAARVHVMQETAPNALMAFRQVNTAGTQHLAQQAAVAGVRRLIYLSSIKVNGEETMDVPFTERDTPDPQDAYAVSKWEAEQVLLRVGGETGLEIVIVRLPLVYGPGVGGNFLRLLQWVKRGLPLPLGSLNNRRSLIYLGNLVDVLALCVRHTNAAGKTFLVSDGEDVSTTELIRRVAASLGGAPRLLPFPPGLLRLAGLVIGKSAAVDRLLGSLVVDSSAIRRELSWLPPYSMQQGLVETARWFCSRQQAS